MSQIKARIDNDIVIIEKLSNDTVEESWSMSLEEIGFKTTLYTKIMVDKEDRYKVFLEEPIGDNVLLVYVKGTDIRCICTTPSGVALRLTDRRNQALSASIDKDKLRITWYGGVRNTFHRDLDNFKVIVDDHNEQSFDMPVTSKLLPKTKHPDKQYIRTFEFPTDNFVYDNAEINCRVRISMTVGGIPAEFSMNMSEDDIEDTRDYYVPFDTLYHKGFAMHLRRSLAGNLMFIRRTMEEIEYDKDFQHWESPKVARRMYYLGKIKQMFSRKKVCLYYEKFAEKAEEGAFDVFQEAIKNGSSNSYFIIDANSPDYERIKDLPNVVPKFSKKYYQLLYTASSYISTESPVHINIIRSNNRYFRKSINKINFIFLQHGVTYLKCHGKNSPFLKGKEATPSYMIVGSEKERNVVSEMLFLEKDQLLNTGLPIFSKIDYKHITQDSDDIAVVMLTWKPYEEYLTDFEQSSYYQIIVHIHEVLTKYLPKENIIIVAHPKIADLMANTDLADNVWQKPISEVLSLAKLLITDYSSVCYNSFYQGGGVVFYQEDLEFYENENGKLIPADDEYIGPRVFSLAELDQVLTEGLSDQTIHLDKFRNEEYERRYATINEFSDGKNIERICKELQKLGII